jgi:2-polyprenyl-6-methoxyphenol hydroxylase-like FAD-dependent oxidoreductase
MSQSLSDLKPAYDAIVIGANCAGAATAMLLARQGLDVLAIDRSPRGHETLSTHALMRGGVLQLRRWDLLDAIRQAGTPRIETATFHYGDDALRFAIEPRDGVDALYAPKRTLLDPLLAGAAAKAGAEVRYQVQLSDVLRQSGRIRGVVLQDTAQSFRRIGAGIVIGADGRRSTLARQVGSQTYVRGRSASAVVYGYWAGLEADGYHWHYRAGVSAGVIPTNDELTCVFASVPAARFAAELWSDIEAGYHRVLEQTSPELASRIRSARPVGRLRPFAGQAGFLRQSWGPGWALVGDAGYFKDPITAHGITDALRDAELLARAVVEGTDDALARYQQERDDHSRSLFEATDAIASFEWELATLQPQHRELSRAMGREVALLLELDAQPWPERRSRDLEADVPLDQNRTAAPMPICKL